VVCAMLANKGGLNLSVSYEAFSIKMLGALRQEIIFARHQKEAGQKPEWRSMALISSSHLWENGKNEQSHQDPSLAEILLGEMNDVSRVIFPADANTAAAALIDVYAHQGQLANLIIPKRPVAKVFAPEQAQQLVEQGAILVAGEADSALQLVAVGAYQLEQALLAWQRLADKGVAASLVYLQEPGKYRLARDQYEAEQLASEEVKNALFPESVRARVFAVHTRPEPLLGHLRSLDLGPNKTSALGYKNRGGTLDVNGLLLANGCSWAHLLAELARLSGANLADWLTADELAAINGTAPLTNLLAIGR
jgi:phosphoketolase